MLAFPEMLVGPATEAGMKVPENLSSFQAKDFPHFFVFSKMQLGRSCPSPTSPWSNAKIVAVLDDKKIMTVSPQELISLGFE